MSDLYSEQMVRDLAWLFQSSPLIQTTNFGFEELEVCSQWLAELDRSPKVLLDFMAQKNLKMLGPYFEALWEFYFLNYEGVQLIAKNLQVFELNQTLGEFDFIYQNLITKEYFHLEVAVKYFLGYDKQHQNNQYQNNQNSQNQKRPTPSSDVNSRLNKIGLDKSPMNRWIGPNANDRLDKKYFKMLNHQSKLSETNAGKNALKKFNIHQIKSQVCLLGTLFYPVNSITTSMMTIQTPENAHVDHNKGCWLRINEVEEHLPNTSCWQIIDKPHWMAPVVRKIDDLDSRARFLNKLSSYFEHNHRPLLVSDFKTLDPAFNDLFYSHNKYFIVSNGWPKISDNP